LLGEIAYDACGDRRRISQKGPQEPHRAQLHRKAQTIMQTAAAGNMRLIRIIEIEILA